MSTFRLSAAAFDTSALRSELAHPAAGGFASFEGWVRNHNEGLAVTRLEYEAFEALAVKEGERIIEEARARFPIVAAACVHRIGALAIGDLAVWVGASAHHRDEAFAACRYIIDEVKHRVPIWKKEHYLGGDSGWVNCERCAETSPHDHAHSTHAAHPPPRASVSDYSRQIALADIGAAGQQKLRCSRVLVIGAGGLGVPVLSYLAGAGVGTLTVFDGDRLEASNLHRQPMYSLADVGQSKAELAAARLRALNPEIAIRARAERFTAENARELLEACDLAMDCSDNFATKFLLNDAAVLTRKPVVFASVYQYEGQLQVYRPDADTACLRCLWPQATRDGIVGNCAAGVLGPVPGVLGSLQALEALKLLLDLPGQLRGDLLVLDLTTLALNRIRAPRHAPCRGGACVRITSLVTGTTATDAELELSFGSLAGAESEGFSLIDIRDDSEVARSPVRNARCAHIPMQQLLQNPSALDPKRQYLLLCARGARSRAVAAELRAHGHRQVFSLRGGLAEKSSPL